MVATAHDITERRHTEVAIRQSEEKYRNILETIEDGYFETGLSRKITFFNDALCGVLGYNRDELTGVDYRQYVNEENAKILKENFEEVYRTEQPKYFLRSEIIRKNGECKTHESSISLIRNEAGESIGFRGLVRDITNRDRTEKELKESQQLLQTMIDTLPQAIWWKDSQGVYKGAKNILPTPPG